MKTTVYALHGGGLIVEIQLPAETSSSMRPWELPQYTVLLSMLLRSFQPSFG